MKRNTWPLRLTVLVGETGYLCAFPTPNQRRMLERAWLKDEGRLNKRKAKPRRSRRAKGGKR